MLYFVVFGRDFRGCGNRMWNEDFIEKKNYEAGWPIGVEIRDFEIMVLLCLCKI